MIDNSPKEIWAIEYGQWYDTEQRVKIAGIYAPIGGQTRYIRADNHERLQEAFDIAGQKIIAQMDEIEALRARVAELEAHLKRKDDLVNAATGALILHEKDKSGAELERAHKYLFAALTGKWEASDD